jgi:tRNA(fMet)-specific endonuclease VapC
VGLILDSTIVVAAERDGSTVVELLAKLKSKFGDEESAISAISAGELLHGVWRSASPRIRALREDFIEELFVRVAVREFTLGAARIFGRLDALTRSQGKAVPVADLLIGATALDLGFSIVTLNLRHFRLIPGLKVRRF